MIPIFKAPFFAVNCDEPFDLGKEASKQLVDSLGYDGAYLSHLQKLYNLVKTVRFDHLGVFIYSPEKGTSAARLKLFLTIGLLRKGWIKSSCPKIHLRHLGLWNLRPEINSSR
jgi:hypothetical protein